MISPVKQVNRSAKTKSQSTVKRDRKFTIENLWQELQDVRAALEASERRAQRLELRIQDLEAENARLRSGQGLTEDYLQDRIRKLEVDVAERDAKIEEMERQLTWFRTKVFDSTSEKDALKNEESSDVDEEEGSGAAPGAGEPKKRKKGQQPGAKGHGRTDRSGVADSEIIPLGLANCACKKCGIPYRELKSTAQSKLYEIQIELYRVLYSLSKYVSQCDCEGRKIVTAAPPAKLYPRTDIGSSLWVYLAMQKFLSNIPTSRTLKELSLYGFSLAEGTVAGGFKKINSILTPLYEQIADHCRGADLWNADETTWRVFNSGKKKWWLWLVASDDAVVHILDRSRSKAVPVDFFAGSTGVLMTDRYSSYKALHTGIQKAWCWVHVRRDILQLFFGVKTLKPWATGWLKDIGMLFALNQGRYCLWENNKAFGKEWEAAEAGLLAHVEKMERRWKRELKGSKLKESQKKILNSMKRHWPGLTLFLKDPRIPLHNNRAERLLRNAVILRKNSYGSGSEWAGEMAAKFFSIIQTWLINGLDPQALLLDYFNECAKTPGKPPPDISKFLPWRMSEERKQEFALPKSYKRPG